MWKCLHGLEGFAPLGRRVGEALTWLRGPMPNDWVAKQQTASISRFSGWKYEAHGTVGSSYGIALRIPYSPWSLCLVFLSRLVKVLKAGWIPEHLLSRWNQKSVWTPKLLTHDLYQMQAPWISIYLPGFLQSQVHVDIFPGHHFSKEVNQYAMTRKTQSYR